MSIIAEAVRHLIAAGVTGDALVTAIADMETAQKPQRSSAAVRQARYRENKRNALRNVDNEHNNVTVDSGAYIARADAPVCSNDISNEISKLDNPLPTVGPLKSKNPSPKEILSEVVSEKTAADVVAHRKALRKPLTPRAAELLAKTLAASGDAEQAAATMIERGWQGYRADWDTPRSNARAGPSEYPGTKKTEFMAFYEQLCEDTKGYGNKAESEVSNGNVLSLSVVRHEDRSVQGDVGELSAVSPRLRPGSG